MSTVKTQNLAFSLLELMVTLAIIGLLMAIATPVYTDHINKGQVADALNTLSKLELAGKVAYEENQVNTSITYAGVELLNNTVTPIPAAPVVNALYIPPSATTGVAANQFVVCVYVSGLNFSDYLTPPPGDVGAHSRICKKVTANDPVYSVTCGKLDDTNVDVPLKYLPPTCQCNLVLEGPC